MVAAGAKRGPPPASSGASSAAYKSAPVAPTVGKRVVNGLQALKRAATAVVSAAKGSTTVTAPTTASSSVRLASDVGGAHHHRHSTAPSAPLKKLTIRAPSGYTTNVAVMWRRWFCSAPARQALLDQFGAGIKWSAVGGNALNSRSGSITTQTASLNISELSKLHNHCPRLQVALACCRQVEALLATSSLNFVDSDDASSKSSMTAMQPLLRAIVAAVPVVSNSNEGASRRHIFSRFEAMTIIDRVRRVAILTESWDLATRMLPVVRGGEDEEGSAVLFVQKLVQLAQQQSHYLHRLSLQPLFVPSGGHSVAGIQSCSEFDPATRLVLANVLSALEEAATPPPNTWSSEESNNRRPSVTTTSSTALRLRSGVSIEINRERTIATAFALCEQHRLFGLPATLRFLRRNKQQTSWPPLLFVNSTGFLGFPRHCGSSVGTNNKHHGQLTPRQPFQNTRRMNCRATPCCRRRWRRRFSHPRGICLVSGSTSNSIATGRLIWIALQLTTPTRRSLSPS
ncbi:Hypothetical protein, putative [Bodo saltans]|uniref:Uncharacterized protein n=1 Tax=Bodo saltans TaxID=75058 RepID=A0A0S4KGR1_BODSA|nr:Hypothetical protein, putative [Bodo saltans]|eukprot:CUI14294.1 Hypothetical protein, putative [Bodo saltans]